MSLPFYANLQANFSYGLLHKCGSYAILCFQSCFKPSRSKEIW